MQRLISFTGPSAAGKTTLARDLQFHMEAISSRFMIEPVVSHTTRYMRAGEKNGVDYYYVSPSQFDELSRANGGFVESVSMAGQQYGLHLQELSRIWAAGAIPVVMLDPAGLEQTAAYCRTSNIQYMAFFVEEELPVMLARYLARLVSDNSGSTPLEYHASRIESLFRESATWKSKFTQITDSADCPSLTRGYVYKYQGNEKEVLQQAADAIVSKFSDEAAPAYPLHEWVSAPGELEQLQAEVVEWANATFPDRTPSSAFLKMFSELGEIIDEPRDGLEWADLFILALDLAHMHGVVDVAEHVRRKLGINRSRNWTVNDNGVMSHRKPEGESA